MKISLKKSIKRMNEYGSAGTPFFFIFDFEMEKPEVIPLSEISLNLILYNYEGITNAPYNCTYKGELTFSKYPPSYRRYLKSFSEVMKNLKYGNSYLANLTFPTRIETSLGLYEIFKFSKAKYKLWYKDKFVFFSPEPFIKITDGKIFSYPMKGTIDASMPDAEKKILENQKETAEHNTIVDLIRNDLSMVASEVRVEEFRYIEKVTSVTGSLLQVSSRISGQMHANYQSRLGDIIVQLLPAGSVTGAPKKKTVEIIKKAENYKRGYYTGVTGIYDGKELRSSVMIRYIEKTKSGLVYKSGGGITIHSDPECEYDELIKKVYVPFI
jgi:para-aminobenzoate synthetase component I